MKLALPFRNLLPILFLLFSTSVVRAQYDGAWSFDETTDAGDVRHVLLFSGPYFSWTTYMAEDGAFVFTRGGSWQADGSSLRVIYEFDTTDKENVGTSEHWVLVHNGDELLMEGDLGGSWKALDIDQRTPLTGPWLFSGRESEGAITRRDTNQPRKTMKMLTGSRFQWIAYNTETKEFFGTGGGSYTTTDGVYSENIEFFSRDNNRVGAKLEFKFEVDGNDWHHKGNSTAGDPMYEIWSRRVN